VKILTYKRRFECEAKERFKSFDEKYECKMKAHQREK